jgi:hypothetical protein
VSAGDTAVRTLAFGDLDAGVWGALLYDGAGLLVLGTPAGTRSVAPSVSVEGAGPAERWSVLGEGIELLIDPAPEQLAADPGPPDAEPGPPDADPAAFDQLCRVQVTLEPGTRAIECLGTRWFRPELDLGRLDSLRAVSASFAPGDAVAVLSLRPLGKTGHDADLVSAAVFENGSSAPVGDARLSTTYGADGTPSRVSLELWQGEGEDEYPRRAAGEAAGQGAAARQAGLELQAELFRLHSHDLEAAGVYLVARSR